MKQRLFVLLSICFLLTFTACEKEPVTETINAAAVETTIGDINNIELIGIPPACAQTAVQYNDYVHHFYIVAEYDEENGYIFELQQLPIQEFNCAFDNVSWEADVTSYDFTENTFDQMGSGTGKQINSWSNVGGTLNQWNGGLGNGIVNSGSVNGNANESADLGSETQTSISSDETYLLFDSSKTDWDANITITVDYLVCDDVTVNFNVMVRETAYQSILYVSDVSYVSGYELACCLSTSYNPDVCPNCQYAVSGSGGCGGGSSITMILPQDAP